MILEKQQVVFIQKYEFMIGTILDKFIEDYKEQILDVPEEKRDLIIRLIKELKSVKGLIKELNSKEKSNDFTGI